jgi:hypothetical protein
MGLAVKKVLCRIVFGGNGAGRERRDMEKAPPGVSFREKAARYGGEFREAVRAKE